MSDENIKELFARQEIHDVLCRYCRGLDRMDREMAYSVWHDDGTALYHDMYEGSGHGFVDWVWEAHAPTERHSHQIANSLVEIDGDSARSETYITVVLWTNPDGEGKQTEIVGKGRYLDRWSKRNGRWAIDHREHILDMQTLNELNRGYVNEVSARDISDPSFQVIPKFEDA
ncbi:MAG: nuclear transport factor 2 family protein [Halioglobus sp.]|nr:nuclear transport factor 2 family protein [Halioglobus sp.]